MTTMLIFVRDGEEALRAVECGADRLGVRLGQAVDASDEARFETIVSRVDGRCPISLLIEDQGALSSIARTLALTGADELRLPFPRLTEVASRLPMDVRLIGSVGTGRLANADRTGCRGVMVATDGPSDRLLAQRSIADLAETATYCRTHDLTLSFAGALEPPDVPRLMPLLPDELCFEAGDDPGRLRLLRDLVSGTTSRSTPASLSLPPASPDRIFLRDWIVPVRIGAYVHERAAPQRVRFNVEADIAHQSQAASDMRDIVSYDLITDSIRRLTVEHVDLVETLAEGIAAAVLVHPRVVRVTVTVEKLDLGPGALGCRITRDKAS